VERPATRITIPLTVEATIANNYGRTSYSKPKSRENPVTAYGSDTALLCGRGGWTCTATAPRKKKGRKSVMEEF